jgi:PAS domain S-box-containing protein
MNSIGPVSPAILSSLEGMDGVLPGVLFEWEDGPAFRGFRWIGRNAQEECGVPPEALLVEWAALPLLECDRAAWSHLLDEAVANGTGWSFRGRFVDGEGVARHWRANARLAAGGGPITRFLGQLVDIDADVRRASEEASERDRLRRDVTRSEERFDLAIAASHEGVFDWDTSVGATFYSPTVARLLGGTVEQLPRNLRGWRGRLRTRSGRDLVDSLITQLRGRAPRYGTVATMLTPNGARISVEIKARMLYDRQGRPRRVVGTVADITARVDAERELIASMDAADAANRAKSDFLARMSHELRTPLNSIIGFSTLLQKRLSDRARPDELLQLERVKRNGTHLLELINDILDLSKIEAGRVELVMERTDVGRLIADTVAELEGSIGTRPLTLRMHGPPGPTWHDVDRLKLRQVLVNLIGNALKFTSAGEVSVVLCRADDGGAAWIDVIDSGIGIAPEFHSSIFSPFEQAEATTARRFGGTGLGLSIVRTLVRMMGGEVSVASVPDVGSVFRVQFVNDPEHRARMPEVERAA